MEKGDIYKKVSGYTVYKAVGKRPVIKTCHQKKGFQGKYFKNSSGKYVRLGKSMVCHQTKKAANDKLKAMDPKDKKVVHTHWAVVKEGNKFVVKKCLKSYEEKKLVRRFENGKKITSKDIKCYKSKADANKRAKNANDKTNKKSGKISSARKAQIQKKLSKTRKVKRRGTAFGAKMGARKGGYKHVGKGKWKKIQPKKVKSGYAIVKTRDGRLVLRICYKQGSKRVFYDGKAIPKTVRCYRLKTAAKKALKSKRKPKKVVKRKTVKRKTVKRKTVKRKSPKRKSPVKRRKVTKRHTAFGMNFGRRAMRLNYGWGSMY